MVLVENEHWAATAQTFNFRLYAEIGRTKLTPVKKKLDIYVETYVVYTDDYPIVI